MIIASFWTFYLLAGATAASFIVAFDLIIRNDYKYEGDYTAAQRDKMDDDFTSVQLSWSKDFPMILMTTFLGSIFVFSIIFYYIILIWIEKLFYPEDLNRVFANNNPGERNIADGDEIEVETYKFKAPGIIRKITNTYFAKSNVKDIKHIKRKVKRLIRRYQTKETRHSIDLENMLRDRDHENRRDERFAKFNAEEHKVGDTTYVSNIGK